MNREIAIQAIMILAVVGMIITITGVIEVGVDGGRTTMIDLGRDRRRLGGAAVSTMTTIPTITITMIAMATMTMDTGTAVEVVVEVEGGDRVVGRENGGEDMRMMTIDTKGDRTRLPLNLDPERVMMRSNIDRDPKIEHGMKTTGGETEKQKNPKHLVMKWKTQYGHRHHERAEGGATIKIEATRIVVGTKKIVEPIVIAAIAPEVEAGVVVVSLLVVRSVAVIVIELPMIEKRKKMVWMIIIGHDEAMMKIAKRGGAAITDITVVAEVLVAR